jgi:gliding motility-associated-like protein
LEPKPLLLTISPDTSIRYGESISISLIYQNARGALNFNWLPGEPLVMSCNNCSNPTVYPKISATFTVIVTDSLGCTNYTSTHIKVNHKNEIFVPTGFSPNNDGENDMLYIFGSKGAEIISFRIFDKWGDLLFLAENFITNDLNIGWDGYSRGELMQSGVYPWQAKVRFKDGSVKVFKGGISLLR